MRSCATVAAPPTSQTKVNLPLQWAVSVAETLKAEHMAMDWKVPPSGAQKNREGMVTDNMAAPRPIQGDALVIDDALGLGVTLTAVGKALKEAGADKVYALCVAKIMRGTVPHADGSYGIDFAEERWP